MPLRDSVQQESSYQYCCKKFLTNAAIIGDQSTTGLLTKQPNGIVALFLNYIGFALENGGDETTINNALDYCTNH